MEIEICNTCRTFLSSEHVVSLRATLLLVGEFLAHMFSTSEANLKNSKSNPPTLWIYQYINFTKVELGRHYLSRNLLFVFFNQVSFWQNSFIFKCVGLEHIIANNIIEILISLRDLLNKHLVWFKFSLKTFFLVVNYFI